jgi:hypothetical protein
LGISLKIIGRLIFKATKSRLRTVKRLAKGIKASGRVREGELN